MPKTALIVDDSPLARHVLGKLLGRYRLKVDTAESAEAALEYLKHRRPDVVFMDHLMPGMDGFEALEAIKANPATATIPVMMYTSQQGELYVGQARALGAIGVLPKELKPTEVAQVLQALRLIPADVGEAQRAADGPADGAGDDANVAALLEALFDQQRAALREEIREGYQRVLADSQRAPALLEPPARKGSGATWPVAAAALLLACVTLAALFVEAKRELDVATLSNEQLERSLAEAVERNSEIASAVPVAAAVDAEYLEALVFAVNLSGHYDFRSVPLDESRAEAIGRLIDTLRRAQLGGVVLIDVNVGRFCMNYGLDGEWHLPPAEQLAQDCSQIGWSAAEEEAYGRRQSLAFANTVMAGVDLDERISVQTRSLGGDLPLVSYPLMTDYLTAGEWNAIAAENQRVEVRLRGIDSAANGTAAVR